MGKSAQDRIEKYSQNIDPDTTARYLKSQKTSMIKKESKYFIEITAIEGKIKGLLQNEGIFPFDFANYLFFGRELYKLTSKYPFETALSQANIMAYKWYAKGLSENILKKIGKIFSFDLDFIPITILTGNAQITDVLKDKTFYNTDPLTKLTGLSDLKEHINSESSFSALSAVTGQTYYRTSFTSDSTILSASITTTKRCLIVVFALGVKINLPANMEIRRNGINKTLELNSDLPNFCIGGGYGNLLYATEILEGGTYQYNLVNSGAVSYYVHGAKMKIIAVEFG